MKTNTGKLFFIERLNSTAKQCQNELSVGHRSAKSDIHDFLFDIGDQAQNLSSVFVSSENLCLSI